MTDNLILTKEIYMFSKKEILCTLGPASMNKRVIERLTDLGVDLFRVNMSHTEIDDLSTIIEKIRQNNFF